MAGPITAHDLETDPFLGLQDEEPDSWTPTVGKEVRRLKLLCAVNCNTTGICVAGYKEAERKGNKEARAHIRVYID